MMRRLVAAWSGAHLAIRALAVALVVGAIARIIAAFNHGTYWPDEIYQTFEPAHRIVFGAGLMPWEFLEGARNYSMPLIPMAVMAITKALGVAEPTVYIPTTKIIFALLSTAAGAGVYRLARAMSAGPWPSFAAACVWLWAGPAIYFGARGLSETVSAAPLVWGVALLLEEGRAGAVASRRRTIIGASLLGLATIVRISSAVAVVVLLVYLLATRHRLAFKRAFAVLMAWALVLGVMDAIAWHDLPGVRFFGFFRSAIRYIDFNLSQARSSDFGNAPWTYYFQYISISMPALVAIMVGGLVAAVVRRRYIVPVIVAVYLVALSAFAHKEYRFILPLLPLASACVAVGIECFPVRMRTFASALVVALALASGIRAPWLTSRDVGAHLFDSTNVWTVNRDVNLLLLAGSAQTDLCGLGMFAGGRVWTGGITYLHRLAPMYDGRHPMNLGHYNYFIAHSSAGNAGPFDLVARAGTLGLFRIRQTGCAPDPKYEFSLEAGN